MFNKNVTLCLKISRYSIFCLLINLIPGLCHADFQDPTKPNYPKITSSSDSNHVTAEEKLVLSAIWITASGKWATINGVTAKQGHKILNNVKIISINQNSVSLSHNGNIKHLYLLQSIFKSH